MTSAVAATSDLVSRPALRRRRFWPALLAILIAAQLALLAHQFSHYHSADLADVVNECALCSVAAGLTTPPESAALPVPQLVIVGSLVPVLTAGVATLAVPSGFLARGPPIFLRLIRRNPVL